jgi:hypothetical protein
MISRARRCREGGGRYISGGKLVGGTPTPPPVYLPRRIWPSRGITRQHFAQHCALQCRSPNEQTAALQQKTLMQQQELSTPHADGPNRGPKACRNVRGVRPRSCPGLDSSDGESGGGAPSKYLQGRGEVRTYRVPVFGLCVTAAVTGSVAPPPPSTPIGGWCRWCSGAKARTFKLVECSTLHRVCTTFSAGCRHRNYPASRAGVATNRQSRSRAAGGFCLLVFRSRARRF